MKTFKIRAAKGQKEYWVVRVHNNWVKLFLAFYKMSGVPENFLAVCIRNKKGKNKMVVTNRNEYYTNMCNLPPKISLCFKICYGCPKGP